MSYDIETINRKRVIMDRELVARRFDSLNLAIKAEAIVNRTVAEQIDDYQMKIYEIVKEVFPDAIGYSAECAEGADGHVKTSFIAHRAPIRLGEEKK